MVKNIIFDISHHQLSSKINWAKAAEEVALCVIRVQYGSSKIDREYKNHVANCKKYGIPFAHYAYGHFVSVADAKVEAQDFLNRIDKSAKFIVLDTEEDTVESCGTKNVAVASQAFIDVCKAAGWRTGFYVSHHLYPLYGLNKVKADFYWIPSYGKNDGNATNKPDYPYDIWQYTDKGRVSWYGGTLDLNLLHESKSIDWLLGTEKKIELNIKPSAPVLAGWKQVGEKWFYYGQKGWLLYRDNYYFIKDNNEMVEGWYKDSNSKWFYLDPKQEGKMIKGWFKDETDNWFFADDNGVCLFGLQTINGEKYYIASSGMVTGFYCVDGQWKFFNENGSLAHDVELAVKSVKVNSDGSIESIKQN